MRAMKDSGIEWIGEIPEKWNIKRLKNQVQLINEKINYSGQKYIGLENIESWTGNHIETDKNEIDSVSNGFLPGDILFGKLRPYLAKCLMPTFDGICSSELLVLRDFKGHSRLLFYIMLSDGFIKIVDSSTYGTKMPRASWSFIGNMYVPIPPNSKQQAIADYLDRKCSLIDGTIEKQKAVIEKLKLYKQSIITEAVTKGLDPNVKMKDSGIEWIGEIPEGWEIRRLRDVCEIIDGDRGKEYPNENDLVEEGIPFLSTSCIGDKLINFSTVKFITKDKFNKLRKGKLEQNDIVISVRGTIGNTAIFVSGDFQTAFINAQMMIMRFLQNPMYLLFISKSDFWQKFLNHFSYGTAQMQLSNKIIANIIIPIPPISEQQAIADCIDNRCSQIDSIITDKQNLINKLTEYKKSLIYECVTGKREVV